MYSYRHAILHLSAKFRSNQTIVGGVILDLNWVIESCTGMGSRYSRGNRGKSAVMGIEFTVVPWGWGTNLRYFRGDGDSGYGSTRGIADCRTAT